MKYARQRKRVPPPQVSLGDLRVAVGLTIDGLIARLEEITEHTYTRGAISAVENGHRGASADLIEALTTAYGLRPGAITTTYQPRPSEAVAEVSA
jgi:hypothetical protein